MWIFDWVGVGANNPPPCPEFLCRRDLGASFWAGRGRKRRSIRLKSVFCTASTLSHFFGVTFRESDGVVAGHHCCLLTECWLLGIRHSDGSEFRS